MGEDFTKDRKEGFWKWFSIFLFVFGMPQIVKFFIFDGYSLADEWRALAYPLIVALVFAIFAGFFIPFLQRDYFPNRQKRMKQDQ